MNKYLVTKWSSSDSNNDTLEYAVLFSPDNGTSYNTMIFDYNETWFNLSSNDLEDSNSYKVKVLVTDGINTNSTNSGLFSVQNDLVINDLSNVYQNTTERVFRLGINNSFNSTSINNIRWALDTGTTIINSLLPLQINLTAKEEAYVFVYYNYLVSGNYTISATVYNSQYSERRSIQIVV